MYICSCNDITDTEAELIVKSLNVLTIPAFFRAAKCSPVCETCFPDIQELLDAEAASRIFHAFAK